MLLKRQIFRLQFLHRNVKLEVLNGAHQLLPSIVFRAWCFSTLLPFSPLKVGEWWMWAGKYQTGRLGNLKLHRGVSLILSLLQQTEGSIWCWDNSLQPFPLNERWESCLNWVLKRCRDQKNTSNFSGNWTQLTKRNVWKYILSDSLQVYINPVLYLDLLQFSLIEINYFNQLNSHYFNFIQSASFPSSVHFGLELFSLSQLVQNRSVQFRSV